MKIRYGFVTNSSSSSFVLMGIDAKYQEVRKDINHYLVVGRWLSDGQDIFELNKDMVEYLDQYGTAVDGVFSFVRQLMYGDSGDGISLKAAYEAIGTELAINPEGVLSCYGGEVDYHATENVEDLKMRYGRQLGDSEGGAEEFI